MTKKEADAKVICFSNHKGGVGKTSSTCNVGAGLAKLGFKVLLIDLDPQANLTFCVGEWDTKVTVYDCIIGKIPLSEAIFAVKKNLDVAPSSLDLTGAEVELIAEPGREGVLKRLIAPIKSKYDFILIDCPPSLGLLTMNAFTATDEVFVPVDADFLSLLGMDKMKEVIGKIRVAGLNDNLKIGGFLITKFNISRLKDNEIENFIKDQFTETLFKTKIRQNVSIAEAPANKMDIFEYKPKSNGAEDYLSLCKEMVSKFGMKIKEAKHV